MVGRSPSSRGRSPDLALLTAGCAALDRKEDAVWCLEQIQGLAARLRAAREAIGWGPPAMQRHLLSWMMRQQDHPSDRAESTGAEVLRAVGLAEASLADTPAARAVARARLREAAQAAAEIPAHYPRRLALGAVAHSQIAVGWIADGLESAAGLSTARFREGHIQSAAIGLAKRGQLLEAVALLKTLRSGAQLAGACMALRGW